MTIIEFKNSLIEEYCRAHKIKDESSLNFSLFYQWVLKKYHKLEVSKLYELKDDEIFDKLNEIVTWYHLFGKGASIDELLDAKDKLLTLSYRLPDIISEMKLAYKRIKHENEALLNSKIVQNKDDGPTLARSIAKSELVDSYSQEYEFEHKAKQGENIIKSINEIAKAMTQRIAWLRQEYSNQTQV